MADTLPKPKSQRRRRNASPAAMSLPASGSGLAAPELPNADTMLPWTLGYWDTIWASPMAVAWRDADVPALIRMARLQDRAMRNDASAAELAEIRQLEDRFGLSPLARRRLQWEIEQATVERQTAAQVRQLRAV